MKVLRIDPNAHALLIKVRDEMKESGIENATISEAVRELDRRAKGHTPEINVSVVTPRSQPQTI